MNINSVLEEILEDHLYGGQYDFSCSTYLKQVETETWVSSFTEQFRQVIYWSNQHAVHIAVNETRRRIGDGYDYYDPEVQIVKPVERTIVSKEWVTV